jgi:adhesin/invasin
MRYGKLIVIAGFLVLLVLIIGCKTKNSDVSSGGGTTSTPTTPTGTTALPPASITSTATPTIITVMGTSTVVAVVLDSNGKPVVDGTQVSFTLSDSSYGALSNSVATTAGSTGTARATFTAANKAGTVIVTVLAGTATTSTTITINPSLTGSIQFESAVPQVIGLKGTGQPATSNITFSVKDNNGNNVADGTSVTFTMLGPGGGAYIGNTTGATTALGSTVDGLATVTLNSGNVAGPVIIIASTLTAGGLTISSSAGQISIGGGVPSFKHFNLATTKFNLPGFVVSGATADISAYVGDRFGNYNVLQGTSISFYTEAGAIDRQGICDDKGLASVTFRTQDPLPFDPQHLSSIWGPADPLDEIAEMNYLNSTYGLGLLVGDTLHPRNGWVSVLATVQGEESFLDENGNGLFDSSLNTSACPQNYTCECVGAASIKPADVTRTCAGGASRSEAFIDLSEPFIDANDDGCRNDAATKNCDGVVSASTDPFEIFIDANNNGVYDPPNGKWDGPSCTTTGCLTSKMIWTPITLAFTGNAAYCAVNSATISIPYGSSQSYSFMVGDLFTNALVAGTTIKVSATGGGTLTGQTSYTIPDGVPFGPAEIFFNLASAATGSGTVPASLTIDVTSPDVVGCTLFVNGTFHP